MECTQNHWLSDQEYLSELYKKINQQRIPLYGSIDLTDQCNLKCIHCYMEGISCTSTELTTNQWKGILDDITEAGCMNLLITGGEPLLRKDFIEIYSYAKTRGLLITIFTNGTLINDQILAVFDKLPPLSVEISLYGATAETYDKVTGVKGSFEKCIRGIKDLLARRIKVQIKTVLMTLNLKEFEKMEAMARKLGVKFRFDAAIFPRRNGDSQPLQLRIDAKDAVDREFSDPGRLSQWTDFYKRMKDLPTSPFLFQCGAGQTAFHIDSYGYLQPCLLVTDPRVNILDSGFSSHWDHSIAKIRKKKPGADYPCNQCDKRMLCGFCPGFFKSETGEEDVQSEYLCQLGNLRYNKIHHYIRRNP